MSEMSFKLIFHYFWIKIQNSMSLNGSDMQQNVTSVDSQLRLPGSGFQLSQVLLI